MSDGFNINGIQNAQLRKLAKKADNSENGNKDGKLDLGEMLANGWLEEADKLAKAGKKGAKQDSENGWKAWFEDLKSAVNSNMEIFIKLALDEVSNADTNAENLASLYSRVSEELKKLDLNNPQTFNEKLQWLKLHDRKPEYTMMVDKYEAKEYVAGIIGKDHIIPTDRKSVV